MALLSPLLASADEWMIEPVVSLSGRYDSNLLLQADADPTFGSKLAGEATILRRTERTTFEILPWADLRRYPGDESLNSNNGGVSASVDRLNELSQVEFGGAVASESTLISERGETGIFDSSVRRESASAFASWMQQLSPRHRVGLTASWLDARYPDGQSVGLYSYTYPTASLGAEMDWSERTVLRLSATTSELTAADLGTRSTDVGIQLTATHALTSATSYSLTGGYSETDVAGVRGQGFTGAFTLTHTGERFAANLSYDHGAAPSASGVLVDRAEARASLSLRVNPRLDASLLLRAVLNEEFSPAFAIYTRTFYAAQATLNWRIASAWYLGVSAGGAQADDPSADLVTDNWSAGFALRWIPGVRPDLHWE